MSSSTSEFTFKPYVEKEGEEYMNDEQLQHFSSILNNWKAELMQEVDRTVHHMQDEAANFPDPNDRATQESEFSLELRTRDRERRLIKKIDESLKDIETGGLWFLRNLRHRNRHSPPGSPPHCHLVHRLQTLDEIREKTAGLTLAAPLNYIGRFAPSPTGPLHLGSLYTALASFLDARHHQGRWLLRMDDLDTPRNKPGAVQAILDCLEAYGLHWDGEVYYQSRHLAYYAAAIELLQPHLYGCVCSRKQLADYPQLYPAFAVNDLGPNLGLQQSRNMPYALNANRR